MFSPFLTSLRYQLDFLGGVSLGMGRIWQEV